VLLDLGICYNKAGDPEKAEMYLVRLIEKYPTSQLVTAAKKELSTLKKAAKQ